MIMAGPVSFVSSNYHGVSAAETIGNSNKSARPNYENSSLSIISGKLDEIKKQVDESSSFLSPAIIIGFKFAKRIH